ncbi:MAG TPA: hypothetical protein VKB17_01515 [Thermoleophilaceae bacterium]|nr:hypothetical protein [Thermoleophilaceae bacterium]
MASEVEKLTARKVVAFMSTSHQEPDLQVEIFVLEPFPGASGVAHISAPEEAPAA